MLSIDQAGGGSFPTAPRSVLRTSFGAVLYTCNLDFDQTLLPLPPKGTQ